MVGNRLKEKRVGWKEWEIGLIRQTVPIVAERYVTIGENLSKQSSLFKSFAIDIKDILRSFKK